MIAPVRDLVNIHSNLCPTIAIEEDIIMTPTRGRTPGSLKNSLREVSISSTTLFKPYYEHIEIQNLNSSWFGQVEHKCFP